MSDLMVNNATPILIGLGVAFVVCLGLIVFGWFQWRKETNQRLAAMSTSPTAPAPTPQTPTPTPTEAVAVVAPAALSAAPPTAVEPVSVPEAPDPDVAAGAQALTPDALRLLRDPATGKLMVEIGGQVFSTAREVRRPELQRLLLGSTRDLLVFLGQTRAAAALPAGPAPTETSSTEGIPADASLPAAAPTLPVVARPATSGLQATGAIRLPSMNPFQQLKVVKELNATPEAPELTIAQQIDNLLQDLTAVSPLAGHGLRVAGSPDGLVSFELDGHSYPDIDSVPNPMARDLLRAAVKRWEAQAG